MFTTSASSGCLGEEARHRYTRPRLPVLELRAKRGMVGICRQVDGALADEAVRKDLR